MTAVPAAQRRISRQEFFAAGIGLPVEIFSVLQLPSSYLQAVPTISWWAVVDGGSLRVSSRLTRPAFEMRQINDTTRLAP